MGLAWKWSPGLEAVMRPSSEKSWSTVGKDRDVENRPNLFLSIVQNRVVFHLVISACRIVSGTQWGLNNKGVD